MLPTLRRTGTVASKPSRAVGVATACARWKVRQSRGRVGPCFDSAVAGATFSTIKVEYVHRRRFRTRTEARLRIATWITDFSNQRRRHSVCNWRSPIEYERSTACVLEDPAA
jgi:transposase InsO family protein